MIKKLFLATNTLPRKRVSSISTRLTTSTPTRSTATSTRKTRASPSTLSSPGKRQPHLRALLSACALNSTQLRQVARAWASTSNSATRSRRATAMSLRPLLRRQVSLLMPHLPQPSPSMCRICQLAATTNCATFSAKKRCFTTALSHLACKKIRSPLETNSSLAICHFSRKSWS